MNQQEITEQMECKHQKCAKFMKKLVEYSFYPEVKNLLLTWKDKDKNNLVAIDTFMKISHLVHEKGKDQKLSDCFDDCLIKQAVVPKKLNFNTHNSNTFNNNPDQLALIQPVSQKSKNKSNPKTIRRSVSKCSKEQNRMIANEDEEVDEEESEDAGQLEQNESSYNIRASGMRQSEKMEIDEYGVRKLNTLLKKNSLSENKQILQNLSKLLKQQKSVSIKQSKDPKSEKQRKVYGGPKTQPVTYRQFDSQTFRSQLAKNKHSEELSKTIQLYMKSIISFPELKNLLIQAGFHQHFPALFQFLMKQCEEMGIKRHKVSIFAPLDELVDRKYPLEQVDQSYIVIPDGYANYSKNRNIYQNQHLLNRKYVSVPLGSEVNFVINKKTEYEEQLFINQQQRYQIDSNIQNLRACIKLIKKYITYPNLPKRLQSVILKRIVTQLYSTNENIYGIFINHFELATSILLPRLIQKYNELMELREKLKKVSQEVAQKNFYKSLDYRCYYFVKNDKKMNCPVRWIEQISLRKKQILQEEHKMEIQDERQDKKKPENEGNRQDLQHNRQYHINSFENVTSLELLNQKTTKLNYPRKCQAIYPKYPHNQILFILNFENHSILNDVLEIVLYHLNQGKKKILELLIFRLMRTSIKRKIKKYDKQKSIKKIPSQDNKNRQNSHNSDFGEEDSAGISKQNPEKYNNDLINQNSYRLPTTRGNNCITKDSQDEFLEMIEEENEATFINNDENDPFEGPEDGFTFIGTKTVYILIRYILAMYHRFQKAKQFSLAQQNDSEKQLILNRDQPFDEYPENYKNFLSLFTINSLTSTSYTSANQKLKDKKSIEEELRKIYQNNAFIFFTLEKLLQSTIKVINNINNDSLTYKILKDGTKDYELGIFEWDKFEWKNVNEQLIRLYSSMSKEKNDRPMESENQNKDNEFLFRFTFLEKDKNFYVSAWKPPIDGNRSKEETSKIRKNMNTYTQISEHNNKNRGLSNHNDQELILLMQQIVLRGQSIVIHPKRIPLITPLQFSTLPIQKLLPNLHTEPKPAKTKAINYKPLDNKKWLLKQVQRIKCIHRRYLY